ncbi:hypothetical protein J8I87_31265 [Paraburkholderia sp. LEh10]|jgi:hypothetical protein|uniref:hypothetical protein n=1 Tax=Paraburkholderia sp. LEh10 TaxID=2821353 RepID=UPI001AE20AF1|nr:hypothetical protein [Paraburkholderia sp. LEh10]MBP0594077.1 hypothetical protein [Paraburkholderia sp. LEh10]
MISKASALARAEASVLEQMAASRANLVAARHAAHLRRIDANPPIVARVREYISVAPNKIEYRDTKGPTPTKFAAFGDCCAYGSSISGDDAIEEVQQ